MHTPNSKSDSHKRHAGPKNAQSRSGKPYRKPGGSAPQKPDARWIASQVLFQVLQKQRSLDDSLTQYLERLDERDRRERALAQSLCYGVLRHLPRLQAVLARLVQRPLPPKDQDIQIIFYLGLYQLSGETRIPPHAAISTSVELCRRQGKDWAAKLVNGVLRNFQRSCDELLEKVNQRDVAKLAHPQWWLKRLQQDWPQHWQAIASANNQQAPMSLRINARQLDRLDYVATLRHQETFADLLPHTKQGLVLRKAMDVLRLPGFAEGQVSVQDGAAQRAAEVLAPQAGERVLDACAAPGGKTAHLLEMQPDIKLLALENTETRIPALQQTLERLQLEAQVQCCDAADVENWWDGQPFDRILLDAPCSASGVIRRHPDIKYLRRESDLQALNQQQSRLLQALWATLRPGGRLLYATCSVFAEENWKVTRTFLENQQDAKEVPLDVPWGHQRAVGKQVLPGEDQMDGFYYALLEKAG
ncbi:16S rRNA (cytosine(967)-C(5))-methyltransferase RsmB [Candidatus Venteria ishoeyi]|uniref:16S rRNA (cytosine(967)-C(5))-methyltransferase n=1 Tax=Candidatus Venteria ishoeyi TaxID=1899563 RepID=A0A1H6F9K1_9GAMM|nr:16S rRNA (cytosine(967)-C(5))-methyltransferase RsmB [Candidatus Venteria ishoeyi]MDM8548095.1 16S rRNA (cytosine(967)-C(5))-methyltransferase RsmB [Candidatus Venteria ishoeyi]SEH05694.1 Ribosomal RNA small subunit methyltransferase B [Candidatus Venteria ishoeyi]